MERSAMISRFATGDPANRLRSLQDRTEAMLDHLAALVGIETPSADLEACAAGANAVSALAGELVGDPGERVEADGRQHLRWRWRGTGDRPPVALIGHYDTVWPVGTLARRPFSVDALRETVTGPGCFDMKAGVVQLFYAVAALSDPAGIEVLLTGDEEIGSGSSRGLVEDLATRACAVLVLEPSAGGALKVGRKGTARYRLIVRGRAAHAGLEPEKGVNALTELCHLVTAAGDLARKAAGTSITPTIASAGTAGNVVPAEASAELDVRVTDPAEALRVDKGLKSLATTVPGATLTVTGGLNRPPMVTSAIWLRRLATNVAADLGLGPLDAVTVGGASDGNFAAAMGCPTLDGLGAVGGGAHSEEEWVKVASMPERAALLAELVQRVLHGEHLALGGE